ncbi:MAG: restriction endonuclease subunit S [Gammaproteobacteria bacterium]|nr:restriction endonuclease subunit S [Gammaproteobacteria bacterium]
MNDLRPYRQMKDSGVECLGDVPAHWEVRRLRNLVEMRASNVDKHVRDDEKAVRLCNYVDVYNHDHIRSDMNFMAATATAAEVDRFRLKKGDVLITKDSEDWTDIGVPAVVEEAADDVLCGYHLALLRPRVDVKGEFLLRVLQGNASALQFRVRANGVTRYGLSHNAIKSVWLPVPPLAEQADIVRFLDRATSRIDGYVRSKEQLLGPQRQTRETSGLLGEYRDRLISDVVTGKLDVRDVAARLPNEPEDPGTLGCDHSLAESGKHQRSPAGNGTYDREEAIQ